jgi:hypothetical protein
LAAGTGSSPKIGARRAPPDRRRGDIEEETATTANPSGPGAAVGGAIAIAGAVLILAGAALPWESVNAELTQRVATAGSRLGLDFLNGQIFVLVATLVIVACGARLLDGKLPAGRRAAVERLLGDGAVISVVAGGMVASLTVLDLSDVNASVALLNGAVPGAASVGIGIYLDLLGGAVMLAGGSAAILLERRRDQI